MQLFYVPDIEAVFTITGEEAQHISRVLRMKPGSRIEVTDGKGKGCEAEITEVSKDEVQARVIREINGVVELKMTLHLAVAPTKNSDRYEWMVEKAVELGVAEITPVICNRSERKIIKTERLHKIALAAMKQSGRFILPKINEAVKLSQFIPTEEMKLVAHCMESDKQSIETTDLKKRVVVLIGPEGDFTPDEIHQLLKQDWNAVSLGASRLRTETAAVYAASVGRMKSI